MTSTTARKTKTPRTEQWATLPVTQLAAHLPADAEVDAALVESIQANGITDPLYVATLGDGTYRVVDGLRRLAAATAAALETVPVTYRPVIRTDALTRHPGNVRADLRITAKFRASIREHGVRTAIQIRRNGATLEVVDGHRRLAAAVAENVTHVPYAYEEVSDADTFVDMVTTAVHREGLTTAEEATALFQASELGASARQLAAASGRTQKEAKQLAKVGRSATVAKVAAARLTLDQLARLTELEAIAPDLAAQVEAQINANPDDSHSWLITRELNRAKHMREAAAHRAQLETQGAQFRTLTELSQKAAPVRTLKISAQEHDNCPGAVWVLESSERSRYVRYCANAAIYEHEFEGDTAANKPSPAERKRIISGNAHWDAATEVRRDWLAAFLGRTSHPKKLADPMTRIAAEMVLNADAVMQTKQSHPARGKMLAQLLGISDRASRDDLAKRAATAGRAPAHLFATVAACHELFAPRSAWRTDGTHGRAAVRTYTARYLGWLQELGYEPTPIEAAIINDSPYDPTPQTTKTEDTNTGTLDD